MYQAKPRRHGFLLLAGGGAIVVAVTATAPACNGRQDSDPPYPAIPFHCYRARWAPFEIPEKRLRHNLKQEKNDS